MSPPSQNSASGERDPDAFGAVGKEVNHLAVPTTFLDCFAVWERLWRRGVSEISQVALGRQFRLRLARILLDLGNCLDWDDFEFFPTDLGVPVQ